MPSQKVFRLPQRTSVNDLVVNLEPVPEPAPNEVLIKIRSVALNFRDVAVATGKYPFPVKESVVPCSDLAGDVVDVGDQVIGFAKGDRVVAPFDLNTLYGAMQDWNHSLGGCLDGALREYIALPSDALVKVPQDSLQDYAHLASLVCTGVTAWNAMYGNIPIKPGQTILFLGTGGVSITGLVLAKAAGAVTIVTSSSDEKMKHVQAVYGADHVINYNKNPDWPKKVLEITNGHGADYILENGGSGTIAKSIEAVAYGGNIAVIGFLAPAPQDQMPDVASLVLSKGAIVRGIMVGSKQHLADVTQFVSSKGLKLPVDREFGFDREQVLEALQYMSSSKQIGKVCIKVS